MKNQKTSYTVELPCKWGDTVYRIGPKVNKYGHMTEENIIYRDGEVDEISIYKDDIYIHNSNGHVVSNSKFDGLGKTVFFALEEAEKVLEEIKNDKL